MTRPQRTSNNYSPPRPFRHTLSLTTVLAALCDLIIDEVYCSFDFGRNRWYNAKRETHDLFIHSDDTIGPFPFLL